MARHWRSPHDRNVATVAHAIAREQARKCDVLQEDENKANPSANPCSRFGRKLARAVWFFVVFLTAGLALFFAASTARADTAFLDWSNRIGRPVSEYNPSNPGHAYHRDELAAMAGRDWYLLSALPTFTELGYKQASELSKDRVLLVYVSILHAPHPEKSTSWPFDAAKALVSGSPALNTAGELSIRWRVNHSDELVDQVFHVDPYTFDAAAFAELLVEYGRDRFPVDGFYLDYFARDPWNYPEDAPVAFASDPAALSIWRAHQVLIVLELRRRWPDVFLVGNGRWAMEEPLLVSPKRLLDGVFWERCGGIWWTPEEAAEKMLAHTAGTHFLDPRPKPNFSGWSTETFAKTVALFRPNWIFVEGR